MRRSVKRKIRLLQRKKQRLLLTKLLIYEVFLSFLIHTPKFSLILFEWAIKKRLQKINL